MIDCHHWKERRDDSFLRLKSLSPLLTLPNLRSLCLADRQKNLSNPLCQSTSYRQDVKNNLPNLGEKRGKDHHSSIDFLFHWRYVGLSVVGARLWWTRCHSSSGYWAIGRDGTVAASGKTSYCRHSSECHASIDRTCQWRIRRTVANVSQIDEHDEI